jgi:isoaspartyl peptidase/L-asparaginase-like protein (Ntn-hydrolase superfamily)
VSGGDTVGVVFRCGEHDYAGAVSGGGPWLALPGRIGDVPIPGAALYVGDSAAVMVTGPGEKILSRMLAKAVYDKLASGTSVDATLTWAAADFAAEQLVVAILDARGAHVGPGAGSAWAALDPSLRTSNKAD